MNSSKYQFILAQTLKASVRKKMSSECNLELFEGTFTGSRWADSHLTWVWIWWRNFENSQMPSYKRACTCAIHVYRSHQYEKKFSTDSSWAHSCIWQKPCEHRCVDVAYLQCEANFPSLFLYYYNCWPVSLLHCTHTTRQFSTSESYHGELRQPSSNVRPCQNKTHQRRWKQWGAVKGDMVCNVLFFLTI